MKAFIMLALLFSQVALADTFSYRLFMDEEMSEVLDIKVDVIMTGKFDSSSKVTAVKIWGIERDKTILLFNISGKKLIASWVSKNQLKLGSMSMKPSVKRFIPFHSDTNIEASSLYSLSDMVLDQNGSIGEDGFFVSNDTAEEMALAGYLKKN